MSGEGRAETDDVVERLLRTRELIAGLTQVHAAERSGMRDPLLLAVSKTKPVEYIRAAYDAGQRHFGENYAQELVEKARQLPDDIKWHMIGHVQSNKCKQLLEVPNLHLIETVDSIKLATKLDDVCSQLNRTVDVFVEVKTSAEETKSGVEPEALIPLVDHINACPNVKLRGLMTIGHPDPNEVVSCFTKLRDLKNLCMARPDVNKEDGLSLSMGMSGDLEVAIQLGSDEVRIGSAIFGERVRKGPPSG